MDVDPSEMLCSTEDPWYSSTNSVKEGTEEEMQFGSL